VEGGHNAQGSKKDGDPPIAIGGKQGKDQNQDLDQDQQKDQHSPPEELSQAASVSSLLLHGDASFFLLPYIIVSRAAQKVNLHRFSLENSFPFFFFSFIILKIMKKQTKKFQKALDRI
jgi:hypothetical protein